jgi:hypothetical protein
LGLFLDEQKCNARSGLTSLPGPTVDRFENHPIVLRNE